MNNLFLYIFILVYILMSSMILGLTWYILFCTRVQINIKVIETIKEIEIVKSERFYEIGKISYEELIKNYQERQKDEKLVTIRDWADLMRYCKNIITKNLQHEYPFVFNRETNEIVKISKFDKLGF